MKVREHQYGYVLMLAGIAIALYGFAPQAFGLSTATTGYNYTCSITAQTGLQVVNCSANVVGPEPNGTYIVLVDLGVNGGCTSAYSFTFHWSNGVTDVLTVGADSQAYSGGSAVIQFSISAGTSASASGTVMVEIGVSGTSTFTNTFTNTVTSCSTISSTSVSTSTGSVTTTTTSSSSSTTQTTTSTTTHPAQTQAKQNPNIVAGGAILTILGAVVARKKG